MPGMITVVIGSETWRTQGVDGGFFLLHLALFSFFVCFDQLD